MKITPERSNLVLRVKQITPNMITFLVNNYKSIAIGFNEIKFLSTYDMDHFKKEYLNGAE